MADMRYNVAQLIKGPTGTVRKYQLSETLDSLDPELIVLEPLVGHLTLMRTNQGILALGKLSTVVERTCKRCLEPCVVDVELDIEEEFHPLVHIADAPLDAVPDEERDEALLIDDHHNLDLREVLRQGLWLAMPMEALCRPDCAGLCPQCGGNRNLGECHCDDQPVDSRWTALQALLAEKLDSKERKD